MSAEPAAISRHTPHLPAQPRGEDTRQRILRAALHVFATEGYDGASTRTLAQRAQVNLPAIQYYFGSKEGLYRAVIDDIAKTMEAHLAPVSADIDAALTGRLPARPRLLDLLCAMLDAFAALCTDQGAPDWESRAMFFARAEIEPMAALETLHQRLSRKLIDPCAALIGHLTGEGPEAEVTRLRALSLLGQVTIFCNRKSRPMLGWDRFDADRVEAIRRVVREHTRAIFRAAPRRRT